MQPDLVRGYRNLILGSIKMYFLSCNIVQDEIDFHTNYELKDGLAFFLLAFEQVDQKMLKNIHFQDEDGFRQYIEISGKKVVLTQLGHELKEYLSEKLAVHATMLEFNGIKPQYLGKISTISKRFEKFWQMIINFGNKPQEMPEIDWMK